MSGRFDGIARALLLGACGLSGVQGISAAAAATTDPSRMSLAEQTAAMRRTGEWPYYGGNKGFQRYSPLDQINAKNVKGLKIAWTRPGVDTSLTTAFPDLNPSHYYNATPVFVDGMLYTPNAVGLLEAVDPATGATVWVQQPYQSTLREASGRSMRGIDSWNDGSGLRLVSVRGNYLYAVNAANEPGQPLKLPAKLNQRELQFLTLVCTELTYREIAEQMYLSPRTIDGYRDDLFEKLKVKTRVGLVMYAIKNGIVTL